MERIRRKVCIVCSKSENRLFCIPKDPDRMRTWLERLKLEHLMDKHTTNYIHHTGRICSLHFEEKYFTSTRKERLHLHATVPIDLRDENSSDNNARLGNNVSTVLSKNLNSVSKVTSTKEEKLLKTSSLPSDLQKKQHVSGDSNPHPNDNLSTISAVNQNSEFQENEIHLDEEPNISDISSAFSDDNLSIISSENQLIYESTDEDQHDSVQIQSTPKMKEMKSLKHPLSKTKYKLLDPMKSKSNSSVLGKLRSMLTVRHYEFVKSKINPSSLKARGKHWSARDKSFALNIFFHSPAAYRILRKYLAFPSISTLERAAGNIAKEDGLSPLLQNALCEKVKKMNEKEKLCTIVFGEMPIKSLFSYNAILDMVDGYASGIKENTSGQPATHALIFMLRGIASNWKQVIAYYFRGSLVPEDWYKTTFTDVLQKVLATGMNVIGSICHQGPNNQALYNSLGVTCEKPFFYIDNKQIYALYDMPHLVKSILNSFKKYDLKFIKLKDNKEYHATWKDVEEFYLVDFNAKYRIAPKLIHKHIYGKVIGTNFVTKVFSYSVAAGLCAYHKTGDMKPTSLATAEFLGKMSKIFDSMNSKSEIGDNKFSSAVSKDSCHLMKWEKWIKWIQSWKFISKDGKNMRTPSQSRLIQTLNATTAIWETLKDKLSFLLTNRLNIDCIDDTFSAIKVKGGFLNNPSTLDFRIAIQNVMFFTVKKKSSQTKLDFNLIDLKMKKIAREIILNDEIDESQKIDMAVENGNIPSAIDFENNLIAYICGVITKLLMEKSPCQDCRTLLAGPKNLNVEKFLRCFKEYEDSPYELKRPTSEFYKYILELGHLFFKNFGLYFRKRNLRKNLYELLASVNFDFFQHDHKVKIQNEIINLFIIMMIKYHLKNINGDNFEPNDAKKMKHT